MKNLLKMIITVLIANMTLISCNDQKTNKETTKKESVTTQSKKIEVAKKSESKIKNEIVFGIPEKNIKMMKIKVVELLTNKDGNIQVPNLSIQDIMENKAIFIKQKDGKFAMRFIKVVETKEEFSIVKENILSGEQIITNGSKNVKNGVLRMIMQHEHSHHGHNHGPGGHTH